MLTVSMTSQATTLRRMRAATIDYFAAHPDARRRPGIEAEEEASLINALIRESVWFAASRETIDTNPHPITDALNDIVEYTKELNQ